MVYTLSTDGPFGRPYLKRVLILAPSSLVKNWEKEFQKWLKNKRFYVYAVDGKKKTVPDFLKKNRTYPVLIVSYETFQSKCSLLSNLDYDLIVCDEGHRLKNPKIKIFQIIKSLPCKRKIILTGTPVQNNLKELYYLSDLINPGILGTEQEFQAQFQGPINKARKKIDDSDNDLDVLNKSKTEFEVLTKLFSIINQFLLRRLQSLFNYLPKKTENVVICKLTNLQVEIYKAILEDKNLKKLLNEEVGSSPVRSFLPYISFLRKLCNHPFLINKSIVEKSYKLKEDSLICELSSVVSQIFNKFPKGALQKSGKFDVLVKLMSSIKEMEEKVVVVSHFTQTLDLIEQFCKLKNYKILRLDGSTPAVKRQKLVDEFNSQISSTFVFLLSSKAGGLGLNLVGASNIILYDIDWNPSYCLQSMARIWRDGQKKNVNIYRLLTAGSIDEKIFQRHLDKQNLGTAIGNAANDTQFTIRELKDIFSLNTETLSTIHEAIKCDCLDKLSLDDQSISESEENYHDIESTEDHSDNESFEEDENEKFQDQSSPIIEIKKENIIQEDENENRDEDISSSNNTEENEYSFASDDNNSTDSISSLKSEDSSSLKPDYDEESADEPIDDQTCGTQLVKSVPLNEWRHFSLENSCDFEIVSLKLFK